jgi:hypothetical protein
MLGAGGESARPRGGLAETDGDLRVSLLRRRRCRREGEQARPASRDARAAPLAAAGEPRESQPVIRRDDGRPAECQLPGQLAFGRQARARRQQTYLDRAGERVGKLLVERVGAGGPGADELDQTSSRDHRLPFQSTLD